MLAFDGPGYGEAEYELPIRPDCEVPVSSVNDWLEERADVDAERVRFWGVSLGGYHAPRATVFERRVRARIALTGPFDSSEAFMHAPDRTHAAFIARSQSSDEHAAAEVARRMSLADVAHRIECPT